MMIWAKKVAQMRKEAIFSECDLISVQPSTLVFLHWRILRQS
jgi:hypothetical protein